MEHGSVVSVLDHVKALIDATVRLFESKLEALKADNVALRERTDATARAAKNAQEQSGKAQDAYNKTHNDLQREMALQAERMVPRAEFDTAVKEIREAIALLNAATNVLGRMGAEHQALELRVAKLEHVVTAGGGVREWTWKIGVVIAFGLAAASWVWNLVVR